MHAWAEAYTPKLGWIAFDATACLCADDRYVRVVVGFDAQDSAFVCGFFLAARTRSTRQFAGAEQTGFQTQA